jgi:hypothetical protein
MRLSASRRLAAIILLTVGVLIGLGAVQLRRSAAVLTDDEYVAIAKSTPQGLAYFRRFTEAPCSVTRWWDVTVNCDYLQPDPVQPYLEKFRVRIEPTSSAVLGVEIQTNAP